MAFTKPSYYNTCLWLSGHQSSIEINGVALEMGVNLAGGEWLEGIDAQILLLEGVGVQASLPRYFEKPGLQMLARGEKRMADHHVYTMIKTVYDVLVAYKEADGQDPDNCLANGFFIPSSTLSPLGKDENERFVYSVNFQTIR